MSMALEIAGFVLTVLEIFFPRRAVVFEAWLDSLPERAPRLFYGRLMYGTNVRMGNLLAKVSEPEGLAPVDAGWTPAASLSWHLRNLLRTTLWMVAIGAICAGVSFLSLQFTDWYFLPTGVIVAFVVALFTSTIGLLVTVLSLVAVIVTQSVVHLLNTFTNGRALGAIGLVIAASGILSKLV
jgi:hypothetical protein